MKFKKEDENYIYELISLNVKKYRKLKGWTQLELARNINYSLSFVRAIESSYFHTFSLGAIWRISQVLGIDFRKLCEDNSKPNNTKYVTYKCSTCGLETKMPIEVIKHYEEIYKIAGNKNLPTFDCTNCDGELKPVNPMEF